VNEVRLRRKTDVLWRRSLDAVLVLPRGTVELLTLFGSGPEVWDLLAKPISMEHLVRELATRHDANPAVVEADLGPVINRLGASERVA
jgi:Coenzyme PQQ synthesis protein D (PqqD)